MFTDIRRGWKLGNSIRFDAVDLVVLDSNIICAASLYGQRIGSNYQAQGLKLSKHFKV